MSEARRLLKTWLTEEELKKYAVCERYGFDVPASEVVTILESLAESRAREGELVTALEQIRDNGGRGCDSPNWMQADALDGFDEKWECGGCAPCQAKLALAQGKKE